MENKCQKLQLITVKLYIKTAKMMNGDITLAAFCQCQCIVLLKYYHRSRDVRKTEILFGFGLKKPNRPKI